MRSVVPDQPLVVPLKPFNPVGVQDDRYQTVPILCYHRFGGASGKMSVSPGNFAAQLDWLARNDYRVIRLSQLIGFLQGREALPKRAVVITMDDGYESVHRYALPLLRKHDFPATLFVYTDFIGAGDGLSWNQLTELPFFWLPFKSLPFTLIAVVAVPALAARRAAAKNGMKTFITVHP
mgnify:CR=1 FL=1